MSNRDADQAGASGASLVGTLFDSHARALVFYAAQLCGDPNDVVQQAFLKLAEQRKAPLNPAAWLYRTVRNGALAAARADRRRRRREAHAVEARGHWWFEPSADSALDATAAAEALAGLPPDQREIVTARIWGGLSFAEIGALVGLSDSTAHRRYKEALRVLREGLGEPDEE